jgi:hypothetical protein
LPNKGRERRDKINVKERPLKVGQGVVQELHGSAKHVREVANDLVQVRGAQNELNNKQVRRTPEQWTEQGDENSSSRG